MLYRHLRDTTRRRRSGDPRSLSPPLELHLLPALLPATPLEHERLPALLEELLKALPSAVVRKRVAAVSVPA